ncbi:MAG: DUF58 domain-containing protein [Victivallales bacterium]|nr:DUF58 domain-containing protein [Victivallales bacterium]
MRYSPVKLYKLAMDFLLIGPPGFGQRVVTGKHYRSPSVALAAWFLAACTRVLTIPVVCMLPVSLLLLLHSSFLPEAPLRQLMLILLAILATDWLLGAIFWPRLELHRHLPARAQAKVPFTVRYTLRNRRWLPALRLELDEGLGWGWFKRLASAQVPCLLREQGEVQVTGTLIARTRGHYRCPTLLASSLFPCGIWKHSSSRRSHDVLIVHPAFAPLEQLELPGGSGMSQARQGKAPKERGQAEFSGCRDYHEGDSPRHIHWASSARRGSLVVKEYKDDFRGHCGIFLDTSPLRLKRSLNPWRWLKNQLSAVSSLGLMSGGVSDVTLEAGVSLAAALVHKLLSGEISLVVLATPHNLQLPHDNHGSILRQDALDTLAKIERDVWRQPFQIAEETKRRLLSLDLAYLILTDFDAKRQEAIEDLRRRNSRLQLKIYLLGDKFSTTPGPDIQRLNVEDVLQGRVTRL